MIITHGKSEPLTIGFIHRIILEKGLYGKNRKELRHTISDNTAYTAHFIPFEPNKLILRF
jgi:hypothetical protein